VTWATAPRKPSAYKAKPAIERVFARLSDENLVIARRPKDDASGLLLTPVVVKN